MPPSVGTVPTLADQSEGAGRGMATTDRDRAIADEVLGVVDQLGTTFADRDKLYRRIDQAVFGENRVEIPDAYKKTALEVRSPLPSHIVNTVAAALSINPFAIQFEPVGFGDAHQANATLREHFFEASWKRQEEESRRRLFRAFMWSLAAKGEAVLKTVERSKRAWAGYGDFQRQLRTKLDTADEYAGFDGDARDRIYNTKTEEYKRTAPYPIATTDVPPESFRYIKGEDGFTFCSESKAVPYFDSLARYHAALDSKGRVVKLPDTGEPDYAALGLALPAEWGKLLGEGTTLECIEAWDWEWVTTILRGPGQLGKTGDRGTIVKRIRHGYGDKYTRTLRGPYFHAQGISTAHRLPDKAGLSILYGFLDLFPLLDSLLTIEANAAYMFGWPSFKRTQPTGFSTTPAPFGDDGATRGSADTQVKPGGVLPFDIAPVEMPKAGVELDKMVGLVRNFLELALPSVVQGVVSGDESGYALNQAAHLARLSWDPIVDNAEQALAERVGFESWLIQNRVQEDVYVWGEQVPGKNGRRSKAGAGWLSIGPDDLGDVHRYRARLDPQTPSNEIIEVRAIGEELRLGLITQDEAIERRGGNPDEVQRGRMLQELKDDPDIKQKIKDGVFQRLATIEQRKIAGPDGSPDVMAEAMRGMPGQGGPGGMPDVVQPGQNGQPLTPTPQGAVSGMGPAGRSLIQGGRGGSPVVPNAPGNHLPLPGEA